MGNFIGPIGPKNAFWNKPIPMTGWVDTGIKNTFNGKYAKNVGKVAGYGALALGGAVALGVAASAFKGKRYDARDHKDDLTDLEKDLPKVLEGSDLAAAGQPTLMGEPLVKNGPHGMKVRMQRGEVPSVGADVTSPNIERGGVSVIDGREIKDLGPQNSLAV